MRISVVTVALLLGLAVCGHPCRADAPPTAKTSTRAQLSIGYSLLYQEADGIPKLDWLLMFKSKHAEMARLVHDLMGFYQQLASTMQKLSTEFPAMQIDVPTMSDIEADTRKAIGTDLAKDIAPLMGKTGVGFERETLLTFYDSLNEQRHLVGVMLGLETDPALKKFLSTTQTQLNQHYAQVGALLNRRYFVR